MRVDCYVVGDNDVAAKLAVVAAGVVVRHAQNHQAVVGRLYEFGVVFTLTPATICATSTMQFEIALMDTNNVC